MSDTNPLTDKKIVRAGDSSIRLVPTEGVSGAYLVEILFPLEANRLYCSRFANPMRCALEAAEEALNALKCQCFNLELDEGKPYLKPDVSHETEGPREG